MSTCVWDGRTGRKVRCVAGTQPGYHRQPMDFSSSGTLAVSVLEGFALLRPPRFGRVGWVHDGAGAMDHSVFMGWSRTAGQLMVLSDLGCALYRPTEVEPVATFEAAGRLVAHASSPVVDQTAVLYGEFVAIYAGDGAITARAEMQATSGELHWSHDGQLLAVAWQREDAAGFTVYRRAGLQPMHVAERRGGETRVPVAWHPTEALLAFANGSGVAVHEFGSDSEPP